MHPLVLVVATGMELAAGGRLELSGGKLPVNAALPSQNSFVSALTPSAGIRALRERHSETLVYYPRLFYRTGAHFKRPLLLHRLRATEQFAISRRLTLTSNASGTYGETGYSGLAFVIGQGQTTPVSSTIIRSASAKGQVDLSQQIDRRTTLGYSAVGGYLTRLGAVAGQQTIPTQGNVGLGFQVGRFVTKRDSLSFPLNFGYTAFASGGEFITLSGQAGWERQMSRRTSVTLFGGAMYGRQSPRAGGKTISQWIPFSNATVESVLQDTGYRLSIQGSTGIQGVYNRVLGVLQPRATVQTSLSYSVDRWQAALNGSFYTIATTKPRNLPSGSTATAASSAQTMMSAELPITYSLSPAVSVSFGARLSARAPHLSQRFRLFRREYRGFVSIQGYWGTGADVPNWVQ